MEIRNWRQQRLESLENNGHYHFRILKTTSLIQMLLFMVLEPLIEGKKENLRKPFCIFIFFIFIKTIFFCSWFFWKGPFSVIISWKKIISIKKFIFYQINTSFKSEKLRRKIILQKYRFYNPFSHSGTSQELKNMAFLYKVNSFSSF